MASSQPRAGVPVLGLLVAIAGAVLIVAGVVTYALVSSKLADQKITVSADAAHFGGQQITQPRQAYAEANAIAGHADKIAGGKSTPSCRRTTPIDRP